MFPHYTDVPLERDESSRFLPWIIAFMVYLAVLALAGAIALSMLVARWDQDLAGNLTVQIPPLIEDLPAAGEAPEGRAAGDGEGARLAAALEILRTTPGVAAAEPLDGSEIESLLEPWLGGGLAVEELPLPTVIDVMVEPGAEIDLAPLEARLAAAVPGASIDDHALWFDRLAALARSAELVAALVVVLTGLAAALTVVFVTRSGLSVHRGVIEILHLIGAHDAYIARQFQYHALKVGLKGGLPGLALAALTLLLLGFLAGRIGTPALPEIAFGPAHWAALAGVPVAAGVIAMVTARITVRRTLARMP